MKLRRHAALLTAGLLTLGLAHAAGVKIDDDSVFRPTGKGWGEIDDTPGAKERADAARLRSRGTGIYYHGGPLLNNPAGANVYTIWYGNWNGQRRDDDPGGLAEPYRWIAVLQHQHDLLRRRSA